MSRLTVSALLVGVTVLVVLLFGFEIVGSSDEPIAEDGGPYVPAGEAPVMQEGAGG